jgi:hypothetical protein
MANRKAFLTALWNGDIVGAAGALVAGIMHMIVMGLVLLLLTAISPLLAVILPFVAYHLDSESLGIFALFYFALGGFVSATFTGLLYCLVTRKQRRAAGVTFGQHCRKVAGWPTLSIICSWITSTGYTLMFKDSLLWSDSNMAHAIFFAMAPVAVFSPLWVYLIYRKRQKDEHQRIRFEWKQCSAAWEAAREEEEALWQKMQDDDRKRKDAAWLRSQGIVN